MSFTEVYKDVLSPFMKKYKEAENKKLGKAVLKNAAEAVVKSRDSLEIKGDLPKDLENVCLFLLFLLSTFWLVLSALQAIGRYFKRSVSKISTDSVADSKPVKIKQVYTTRDVIKQKYRELVEEHIPYKPSDKKYLSSYQQAVTTVLENMSGDDLDEVQKIADGWNEQGAPSDLQLKWVFNCKSLLPCKNDDWIRTAKGKLPKQIKKNVEEWKFSSGALMVCLVAYSDGKEVQAFQLVNTSFLMIWFSWV